jgi:hypothetical protein
VASSRSPPGRVVRPRPGRRPPRPKSPKVRQAPPSRSAQARAPRLCGRVNIPPNRLARQKREPADGFLGLERQIVVHQCGSCRWHEQVHQPSSSKSPEALTTSSRWATPARGGFEEPIGVEVRALRMY